MLVSARLVLVLSILLGSLLLVSSTSLPPQPTHGPSKCPPASVNYITHTLPQQCLKTTRLLPTASSNITRSQISRSDPVRPDNDTTSYSDNPASSGSLYISSEPSPKPASSADSPARDESSAEETSSPSSQSAPATTSPGHHRDEDAESPLDNAKFLSFEEWKKERLANSGQSADTLNQVGGRQVVPSADRRKPGNVHNALDSLGEDSEIELDFSGFGAPRKPSDSTNASSRPNEPRPPDSNVPSVPASGARSKDAGRTCKERFNYASFDCAANVLKTNPQCKSSSSILVENKDNYMLNECAAENKFLIVELCEHIQVDTVILANFEFFSSMFRSFRLSVSDRYPVKIDRWRELGNYEARNSREIQAFLVENPLMWARYLRIEFITHYGNEYYCPLSLVRVHGTTMMEDYRHQEELARGEVDIGDDDQNPEVLPNKVVDGLVESSEDADFYSQPDQAQDVKPGVEAVFTSGNNHLEPERAAEPQEMCEVRTTAPFKSLFEVCHSSEPTSIQSQSDSFASTISSTSYATPSTRISTTGTTTTITHLASSPSALESTKSSPLQAESTASLTPLSQTKPDSQTSALESPSSSPMASSAKPSSTFHSNVTVTSSSQSSIATAATPATQESFFQSMHKRLQALEVNATLSLQYIESQSQLLREAFAAVEKRQVAKTASFLESLNSTVLGELARARIDYDQLWQSTVLELASQRDEGRREREMMSERVRLLADELVGQKRMMAVQATLLLLCLGVVVFARVLSAGNAEGVDMGLLQSVQGLVQRGRLGTVKSTSDLLSRRGWQVGSPLLSPPRSADSSRPMTRSDESQIQLDLQDKPLPPPPPPPLLARARGEPTEESDENESPLEISRNGARAEVSEGLHDPTDISRDQLKRYEEDKRQRSQLKVPRTLDRRASSLRGAQSAPSTPGESPRRLELEMRPVERGRSERNDDDDDDENDSHGSYSDFSA